MRSTDRSKLVFPLVVSIALFSLYYLLEKNPRLIPAFGDLKVVFGKDLNALLFAAYVPLIVLIIRLVDVLAFDLFVSRRRQTPVPQLLRDIVALLLYGALLGSAYNTIFNFDLRSFLAGGALIGAVLGLALQDTLGNVFSGIAIHMEDSFQTGDVMKTGEFIGTVESVNWRATRLRTFNNDLVVVPNSVLARERIEIYPRSNLNGRVLQIAVDYNVAPATVISVLVQSARHVDGVAPEVPCIARVASFGDSAISYDIKYFMRDYTQRDRIDSDIRKAAWYALRRNKISIPFPIRAYQQYTPPADAENIPREKVVERLRNVDLLSVLGNEALEEIAKSANVHCFSKGEAILQHGDAGDSMFVVHDGTVSVRVPDESELRWHEVARLQTGGVFGEMALLTGEVRTADVVAVSDVWAIEIDKDALQPLFVANPDLATTFSAQIATRRDGLAHHTELPHEVQSSLMSRIKAWFGV